MLWIALAFLAGLSAGIIVVGVTFIRRRLRRPIRRLAQGDATITYGDADTIHGLSVRERANFLRVAREQAQTQRERWGRDYPSTSVSPGPGRLPGIPRALRVRN